MTLPGVRIPESRNEISASIPTGCVDVDSGDHEKGFVKIKKTPTKGFCAEQDRT